MDELAKIQRIGGAVKAIQSGYIQSQIRESAYKQQIELESGKKKLIGVNVFVEPNAGGIAIQKISQEVMRKQVARVKNFKLHRNQGPLELSLRKLSQAIENNANVMPSMINAVKAKATTGEISNLLREIYGEFHPPTRI
jgi:methylmalonyl-CoA mutase N-terminal domain/subunit